MKRKSLGGGKDFLHSCSCRSCSSFNPFSALGGVAHGLQVAASIKAQQPGWSISWVVRDIFAPLMRASTVVDRVYVFRRHDGARSFLRLMREVRRKEFDVVMDMQASCARA